MQRLTQLALLLCLSHLSAFADTNGISLTLYFPHTEMLEGEWFDYSITLTNGSPRAVPIRQDTKSMISSQFIFDLGTATRYHNGLFEFDDSPRKWYPPRTPYDLIPLPAGESHTWEVRWGYCQLQGANAMFGVTSMAVRCILDTNKWVTSNTVQLKFYPDELLTPVFDEATTPKYDRLYKAKLGDETYLFNFLAKRICRLPEDDAPNIQRNPDNGIVTISFPKSKRKILYDPQKQTDLTDRKIKPVE